MNMMRFLGYCASACAASSASALARRTSHATLRGPGRVIVGLPTGLGRCLAPLLQNTARVVGDAAVLDQTQGLRCHWRKAGLIARARIANEALAKVDLDIVALRYPFVDAR